MKKLILLLSIFLATSSLTGCFWEKTPEELAQEEKENFIAANVEMTCKMLKNPELAIETDENKTLAKEIFASYDFPTDDNETMVAILDKYENDEEVIKAVQEKLEAECELQ